MSYAVLVGPNQDETILLDEQEYKILKRALDALRSEDRQADAILAALQAYTGEAKQIGGETRFSTFFAYLMAHLADDMDEIQGILVQSGQEPLLMRCDTGTEHAVALRAFLKILEAENWLTDFFIPVRIEHYAKKTPTPLEVMQDLAEPAMIFQSDVADAKRMMREWPEVVGNIPSPASAPRGKRAKAQANAEASQSSQAFSSKAGASL